MIRARSVFNNPFTADYSFICGKGELNPMQLKIYFPHSQQPHKPLIISVKRDATVEEAIGYSLYQYIEERRLPAIDAQAMNVSMWNLRIVEDDGGIDEDFPGMTLHLLFLFL
jgi:hypothetical protein